MSVYDQGLDRTDVNWAALTPVGFLERAAGTYPDKIAVIHGRQRFTYARFHERCRRLANALEARGIGKGDTVSVMAPNIPALLEAHYGVLMVGGVLNAINVRLDAATVAFVLGHGGSRLLLADTEYAPVVRDALDRLDVAPPVVDIDDPEGPRGERLGETEYEVMLDQASPDRPYVPPADEWASCSLNYTSGTTGNPKGVVYHLRGAWLNAAGNALTMGLSSDSVYLWTLPMFHCNGWTFTWGVTAVCGTHVCLRRVDPALIFPAIAEHGVTHMCGAPVVLTMLIHAPEDVRRRFDHTVDIGTGGAAPPSAVIRGMEEMGFRVTHLYGMTECYGPSMLCVPQDDWDALDLPARAARMARQGVGYPTMEEITVADPGTLEPVPWDGATVGELLHRGNTVMKGYLDNPEATGSALAGGWLHTGDLGVVHPDGYVEIKDRSKDIIISGGENISSLEVEEALYQHPRIMEAAVVAMPHETWGESPCAFVTPVAGAELTRNEVVAWCRDRLAHFKVPRRVVFGPLPKTSTGKIQKFVLREKARSMPS